MQIGAGPTYLAPAVSSMPVRSVSSAASADVSPDLTRAAQAPATPSPALGDEQTASAREEADQSSGQSTQSADKQDNAEPSPQQQQIEQLEVAELANRDREVRTHEQAHAAVGGSYAGAPSYTYSRGPDGRHYAVAGEVGIDTVANDPQATLSKMEIVVRAALAPAEPSTQDLRVAAQAQAQMIQARVELAELHAAQGQAERAQPSEAAEPAVRGDDLEASQQPPRSAAADLDLYRRTAELPDSAPLIDLLG